MLKLIYSDNASHYYRRQSRVHTVWYRTTVKDVHRSFIPLKFTWCILHKQVLSQLCMEGMQYHDRLLPQNRIELHLDFRCLPAQCQGFDQCIHTYCDGFDSVRSSGSRYTLVSRRRGRRSFLVSSTLFPWWKHSTLHTAHCGHEMLRVVRLKSGTLNHICDHVLSGDQMYIVSSLGH